jgi:hypothetical protein
MLTLNDTKVLFTKLTLLDKGFKELQGKEETFFYSESFDMKEKTNLPQVEK